MAFPDSKDLSPHELVLRVYSEYADRPVEEIAATIHFAIEKVARAWREQYEAHEDTLTSEQLMNFYASFEFPVMCTFRKILRGSLPLAQAALPLYLAQHCRATAAFDFGGNSGLMTSALALTGVQRVLLIDQLPLLDFARWRDRRMNLNSVEYIEANKLESTIDRFMGAFDFGSSTEVLEHVADVEGAIAIFAKLMRDNGILFMSTSFGQHPYPNYEQIGLLPPPARSQGGHRLYGQKLVKRLNFVRRSRELGFSLDEIRELLRLVDGHKYTCAQVEKLALNHVRELERKISDLKKLKKALGMMAAQCTGNDVPECPVIDVLFNTRTSSGPAHIPIANLNIKTGSRRKF